MWRANMFRQQTPSTHTWALTTLIISTQATLSTHSLPLPPLDRLVGLVVRRPPRERKILGSNPACAGIFSGSSHTCDLNIGTPVATLPGSVLGLVGPVSVYCDWVRWKVWSATSISVWQHIKLSVQIRPWDTLACCWDIKQPTNERTLPLLPKRLQGKTLHSSEISIIQLSDAHLGGYLKPEQWFETNRLLTQYHGRMSNLDKG